MHTFCGEPGEAACEARCVARGEAGAPLALAAFARVPGAAEVEGLLADAAGKMWFASAAEDAEDGAELRVVPLG